MNYTGMTSLLAFSFICLFACESRNTKESTTDLPSYELVIVDSIVIDRLQGGIDIVDYHQNQATYLAYDQINKEIIEFNKDGQIKAVLSEARDDDNGYGASEVTGICYKQESIVVISQKGVYIYDSSGKLGRKIIRSNIYPLSDLPSARYFQNGEREIIVASGAIAVLYRNKALDRRQKDYYQIIKNILWLDLKKETFKHLVPIEADSDLQDEQFYYIHISPFFFWDEKGGKLFSIREIDRHVFVYRLREDDFELESTYPTSPQHFEGVKGFPYGNPISGEEALKAEFTQPRYEQVFASNDTLILQYRSGLSEADNDLTALDINNQEGLRTLFLKKKIYLEILHKGQKLGQDIVLPPRIQTLAHLHSTRRIIAYQNESILEEEPDKKTLYVCALRKK